MKYCSIQTPPPTPKGNPITTSTHSRSVVVGSFLAVVFIWSLTPLAAVVTVQTLHWAWGLFLRFSLALVFAFLCLKLFNIKMPFHKIACLSYGAGALGLFGSMTLCYIGAIYVPSAVISIIYGFAPLISGVICIVFLKHPRFSNLQLSGLLLAIIGMGLALGIGGSGLKFHAFGVVLEFSAVLLYVISALMVTRFGQNIHPIAQMTGATLFSWVGYLLLLPFFIDDLPQWTNINIKAYFAIVYSAIFSSVLAMICYYSLIKMVSTNTVMLTTITTPLLATFWGIWLNQEALGHYFFIGLILVCIGLYLYIYRKTA